MSLFLDRSANRSNRVTDSAASAPSYVAQVATNARTRRDAFKLRYNSYLASGHIAPNASELFSDLYDDMPNTCTIVVYQDGLPAASVRTCTFAFGTNQRSPAVDTYGKEVNEILSKHRDIGFGRRGIETTRLVRSPSCENNQGLVFLLYRMAGYVGMMAHTQTLFACVRTNHVPFYKRLGYSTAAPPRAYPGLNCPMQLMVCTRERYDEVRMAYPVIDPYTTATGALDDFLDGAPVALSIAPR